MTVNKDMEANILRYHLVEKWRTGTIATHWTTEEAAQVYEALDTFQTAIWESYGNDIMDF